MGPGDIEHSQPKQVVADSNGYNEAIALLSRRPSPMLAITASLVGAGAVGFYVRSLGLSSAEALILGVLCGGGAAAVVDFVQLRMRMQRALRALEGTKHDG
jgi:hypothetical protein